MDHYLSVQFSNFKAFSKFRIELKHFNILAGPNNAGKSTILAAFRILSSGLRRAAARKAMPISGPYGLTMGHEVDLAAISIAEENIFHNYDESQPALVEFSLTADKQLTLYFPEQGRCFLIVRASGKVVESPAVFRRRFDCAIGFVPILGPVEHRETLYERETAQRSLFNYRAARNFRNIWYHYPEKFNSFQALLKQTWPNMDISRPIIEQYEGKPRLYMFCPENRIPRELFWSGFGFQVWCQMLTHLIQSSDVSLFLIDEPDIYLHSDLQRQLIGILRDLGPDILIATHSTEILSEADTNDILLINKSKSSSRRIKDPSQLRSVFAHIGSVLNPTLTQLAKTRRVLFVEGDDFRIIGQIARKFGRNHIANRRDFAVVQVEGFNPTKIRALKEGIETTLGSEVVAFAIFDRDYRCEEECLDIPRECNKFCNFVLIHDCKEIENYLLIPSLIERAIDDRQKAHAKRTGGEVSPCPEATKFLLNYAQEQKAAVIARSIAEKERFERFKASKEHKTNIMESAIKSFEIEWQNDAKMLSLIGGKSAFTAINEYLESECGTSISYSQVINCLKSDDRRGRIELLLNLLDDFVSIPLQ